MKCQSREGWTEARKASWQIFIFESVRGTHLCAVMNMDAIDRQDVESTLFESSSRIFLHCCDMLNLFTFSVPSLPFLMINGLFAHFSFEKKFLWKTSVHFATERGD